MPRSRPGEEQQGKEREKMHVLERCSELLAVRRRLGYLTAKWTGRRRPNHQSGSPTGCLKNLCLRKWRKNMKIPEVWLQSWGSGTQTRVHGSRFDPTHGSP